MKKINLTFIFLLLLPCASAIAVETAELLAAITAEILVSPPDGSELIDKKPLIRAVFPAPVDPASVIVILDGVDMTPLANITETGFEFRPVIALLPGRHGLSVSVVDREGRQLLQEVTFTTRTSDAFEEAFSRNDVWLSYDNAIDRPENDDAMPDSRFEGHIRSYSGISERGWRISLDANVRYLDQNAQPVPPRQNGIDAANWLLTAGYSEGDLRLRTELGDVLLNETQNTVFNLSRRGGIMNLEYDDVSLRVFSVMSGQVYGLEGNSGIGGASADRIAGASGSVKFMDEKMEFGVLSLSGGEEGSSFGAATASAPNRGSVFGVFLNSDFFDNRFKTELESDFSDFDPDTDDDVESKRDRAARLRVSGVMDRYHYEAAYEYLGRDYGAVGNQWLRKDMEGFRIGNGYLFGPQTISVFFSRNSDNVRDDGAFPTIVNYQGMLDYSYQGIPDLPMGLSYQKGMQDSTKEPEFSKKLLLYSDTIAGRVHYAAGVMNLGFQAAYSSMNDRTPENNDTTATTYTITPGYNVAGVSMYPSFSLNVSKNRMTEVNTDTYTAALDLRVRSRGSRASFSTSGAFNIVKASDSSMDARNLNIGAGITYEIQKYQTPFFRPAIGLKGAYSRFTDTAHLDTKRNEFTLYIALTAGMSLVY